MGGGGDARGELEVPDGTLKAAYYGTFLCLSALRRRDFHRAGRRAGGIFSPDFGMTAWSGRGYASDRNLKRLETNCVPEPYLLLHPHRT